jgi:hypothetical protein
MVLSQSETPYWQNPPTALAMMIHGSKNVRSYGGAYECWCGVRFASFVAAVLTEIYLCNVCSRREINIETQRTGG